MAIFTTQSWLGLSVTVSVGEILESVPSCLGKYIPSKNRFVVSNCSGFGDHIIVFKKTTH